MCVLHIDHVHLHVIDKKMSLLILESNVNMVCKQHSYIVSMLALVNIVDIL